MRASYTGPRAAVAPNFDGFEERSRRAPCLTKVGVGSTRRRWVLAGLRVHGKPVAASPAFFAIASAIGSALLALWIVLRKPSVGPRTVRPAFLLCALAYGLLLVSGPLMKAAVDAAGPAVALLVVFVPVLAFAFWSAGVLMRAVILRLPGAGH